MGSFIGSLYRIRPERLSAPAAFHGNREGRHRGYHDPGQRVHQGRKACRLCQPDSAGHPDREAEDPVLCRCDRYHPGGGGCFRHGKHRDGRAGELFGSRHFPAGPDRQRHLRGRRRGEPVAVQAARKYGADLVIAVDISSPMQGSSPTGTMETILQSVDVMYSRIAANQISGADVIIRPNIRNIGSSDFSKRHEAILEGEKAALPGPSRYSGEDRTAQSRWPTLSRF